MSDWPHGRLHPDDPAGRLSDPDPDLMCDVRGCGEASTKTMVVPEVDHDVTIRLCEDHLGDLIGTVRRFLE